VTGRASLVAIVFLHPGVPDRAVVHSALERIVANDNPPIRFKAIEGAGGRLPADGAAAANAIADAYAASDEWVFGVDGREPSSSLVIAATRTPNGVQGALTLGWPLAPGVVDGFVDLLVDLVDLLCSPLAVLSHEVDGGLSPGGWGSRETRHHLAIKKTRTDNKVVPYGLFRGLAGIAHRMVLGDELVAMFGEQRLASLDPSQGRRYASGHWVLATTAEPLDWTHDRWCPQEAAAIDVLGPEHFFDPEHDTLPKVVPTLPGIAPYRCRTWDVTSKRWVWHDPADPGT
jgi:hypothetical protein